MVSGFIALITVFWIIPAIVVGIDASINSSKSGFLWGLAIIFGGIFGVLIYILLGRDAAGNETERSHRRGNDAARRRQPSHVCQSCGEEYYTDETSEIHTCRNCGGVKVESTRRG